MSQWLTKHARGIISFYVHSPFQGLSSVLRPELLPCQGGWVHIDPLNLHRLKILEEGDQLE